MPKAKIVDVCAPGKSNLPENLCEDFTNNLATEVWPHKVIAFHQLLEPDKQK